MTSSRCIRFLCAYVRACECARLLVPTCVPVSTFDTSRPTFMDLDKLRFCVHHCTTDAFLKPLKLWRRANFLTHCGRVTQICVFNTVKLGKSASSPQCRSTRGNVSRGITPSSTTRVFGKYFLKISFHKNSQRICYKFLNKHNIKVD